MTTPDPNPAPAGSRVAHALALTAKAIGWLLLVAAISAGISYLVFQYTVKQEQQSMANQVTTLRQQLTQRQDDLEKQLQQVQQAATGAQLLLQENGQTIGLDAKLKEIDSLKLELQQMQTDMDTKLQNMQQSVATQVAQQGKETAQAVSAELRWKSLLIQAQGQVMLAQFDYSQGNHGLAKDDLSSAQETLQQAQSLIPDSMQADLKQALDQADQAKTALILEQSSARDALNLLWHHVNDLIAQSQ